MHVMEIISGTTVNGAITHCRLLTGELLGRGHTVTLVGRPGALPPAALTPFHAQALAAFGTPSRGQILPRPAGGHRPHAHELRTFLRSALAAVLWDTLRCHGSQSVHATTLDL